MDACFYHNFHDRYREDIPFWIETANQLGSPILELGCGTGRVLLPLVQAGHCVIGLDNDAHMLAFLKQRIPIKTIPHIHLLQADLTQYHFGAKFRAIFAPCNTLSTLAVPDIISAFNCAIHHLETGGALVASMPNPEILASLPEFSEPEVEDSFPHPLDGEPVQVSSCWVAMPGIVTFYWHYDHLLPDGHIDRVTIQSRHHLVSASTYMSSLINVGFKDIQLFGDFNRVNFNGDSPNLIIFAFK